MTPFQSKILQHKLTQSQLEIMEEHAFYESGLVADGCLDHLDVYTKQCIKRYGRILLKSQTERLYCMGDVDHSYSIDE